MLCLWYIIKHFCESHQSQDILTSWVENFCLALLALFEYIFPILLSVFLHQDVVCQDFVSPHIAEPYHIRKGYKIWISTRLPNPSLPIPILPSPFCRIPYCRLLLKMTKFHYIIFYFKKMLVMCTYFIERSNFSCNFN